MMEKTPTQARSESGSDTPASASLDEVTSEREKARLVNGTAMEADSFTIERHSMSDNDSGESGSQGNTLGREDQNPVNTSTGGASSPDQSRGDTAGGGTDER